MRKIKREAFDALPEKQKIKVPVSPLNNTFFAELPKHRKATTEGTAVLIRFGGTVLEIQNGAEAATIENTLRVIKSLC
jgi:starvation-inducible outer membrane lipoprotein